MVHFRTTCTIPEVKAKDVALGWVVKQISIELGKRFITLLHACRKWIKENRLQAHVGAFEIEPILSSEFRQHL